MNNHICIMRKHVVNIMLHNYICTINIKSSCKKEQKMTSPLLQALILVWVTLQAYASGEPYPLKDTYALSLQDIHGTTKPKNHTYIHDPSVPEMLHNILYTEGSTLTPSLNNEIDK